MANHTRKFTDEQRAAIAADIRDTAGTPDGSYRKIAARHGCSVDTVQKVAKENGLADRWQDGQHQTAAATSVKQTNAADRRATLQLELLDLIDELRRRFFGEVTHLNVVKGYAPDADIPERDEPGGNHFGPLPEYVAHTVLPAGPRDWRDTAGAIAALTGRHIDLAKLEAEMNTGEGEGAALLREIAQSLGRNG